MLNSNQKYTFSSLRNIRDNLESQISINIYNKISLNYNNMDEKYNNYNV